MPGDGAVWPAMVRNGSLRRSVVLSRSMTPPTSNTTIRGPDVSSASRREPGPEDSRFVTGTMRPPRPPGVAAAQPTAPGNAPGTFSFDPGAACAAGSSRTMQSNSSPDACPAFAWKNLNHCFISITYPSITAYPVSRRKNDTGFQISLKHIQFNVQIKKNPWCHEK